MAEFVSVRVAEVPCEINRLGATDLDRQVRHAPDRNWRPGLAAPNDPGGDRDQDGDTQDEMGSDMRSVAMIYRHWTPPCELAPAYS